MFLRYLLVGLVGSLGLDLGPCPGDTVAGWVHDGRVWCQETLDSFPSQQLWSEATLCWAEEAAVSEQYPTPVVVTSQSEAPPATPSDPDETFNQVLQSIVTAFSADLPSSPAQGPQVMVAEAPASTLPPPEASEAPIPSPVVETEATASIPDAADCDMMNLTEVFQSEEPAEQIEVASELAVPDPVAPEPGPSPTAITPHDMMDLAEVFQPETAEPVAIAAAPEPIPAPASPAPAPVEVVLGPHDMMNLADVFQDEAPAAQVALADVQESAPPATSASPDQQPANAAAEQRPGQLADAIRLTGQAFSAWANLLGAPKVASRSPEESRIR